MSKETAPKNPTADTSNEKFDGAKKRGAKYRSSEFDHDFLQVYLENPFLGVVSMEISKIADEGAPTAYMSARPVDNDYDLTLGYSPDFMRSLPKEERAGVIIHELYHLIFRHITSRVVADDRFNQLWNVATDLAINSIISAEGGKKAKIPDFGLLPGRRPTRKDPKTGKMVDAGDKELCDFIAKAPPLQASDFYFEKMKEIIEEQDKNGGGGGGGGGGLMTLDDHSQWGDLPPEVEELLNERMRDLLEKAIRHADNNSNSWGNIPMEIQEQLRRLVSREIDWRSIIKNFVGRCRSVERVGTLRRINKRAPYLLPGAKRKTHARFACFIDQSGSMGDEDICMLFGELEGLAKETEIDVFHFDTELDEKSHTVWKKSQPFPKAHRTRSGGTDFDAVSNFCNRAENRGKWSGVIILTDGYAPTMGQIVGAKVLWVITPGGTLEACRPGDLACQMKKDKGKFKSR